MTPEQFVKSTEYLPEPLRDFHDQKRLFKRVWENVENKKRQADKEGRMHYFGAMDWLQAHVFVIDFFLWFMALHGYTLQKSRRQIEFYDFDVAMKDFDARQLEAMRAEFADEEARQ